MSFPSAVSEFRRHADAAEALYSAFQRDTPIGFTAVSALAEARRESNADPVAFIRSKLERFGPKAQKAVLRASTHRMTALKVDFDPLSELGRQVTRLLGTDVARPILERRLGMKFGFANCCGGITDPKRSKVMFTAADQIEWQNSIDC